MSLQVKRIYYFIQQVVGNMMIFTISAEADFTPSSSYQTAGVLVGSIIVNLDTFEGELLCTYDHFDRYRGDTDLGKYDIERAIRMAKAYVAMRDGAPTETTNAAEADSQPSDTTET